MGALRFRLIRDETFCSLASVIVATHRMARKVVRLLRILLFMLSHYYVQGLYKFHPASHGCPLPFPLARRQEQSSLPFSCLVRSLDTGDLANLGYVFVNGFLFEQAGSGLEDGERFGLNLAAAVGPDVE